MKTKADFMVVEDGGKIFLMWGATEDGYRVILEGYEELGGDFLAKDLETIAKGESPENGHAHGYEFEGSEEPGGVVVMDRNGCYLEDMSQLTRALIARSQPGIIRALIKSTIVDNGQPIRERKAQAIIDDINAGIVGDDAGFFEVAGLGDWGDK